MKGFIQLTNANPNSKTEEGEYTFFVKFDQIGVIRPFSANSTILLVQGQKMIVKESKSEIEQLIKLNSEIEL